MNVVVGWSVFVFVVLAIVLVLVIVFCFVTVFVVLGWSSGPRNSQLGAVSRKHSSQKVFYGVTRLQSGLTQQGAETPDDEFKLGCIRSEREVEVLEWRARAWSASAASMRIDSKAKCCSQEVVLR
jgi:hypothetical protein